MLISKGQSIFIAVAVLGVAFGAMVWSVQKNQPRTQQQPGTDDNKTAGVHSHENVPSSGKESPASEVKAAVPGQIVLDKFHRVETKNGRTLWEVKAARGTLDPRSNEAVLDETEVMLSQGKEVSTSIIADHARVSLEGATLKKAHAWGNVQVQQGQLSLRSEEATYDLAANSVEVPGPVEIKNEFLTITGKNLSGNSVDQIFTITHDVETTIHGNRSKK